MKLPRRRFLHLAASAVTLPATQQIAKAEQTTLAQTALDPLVWPVVTKVPRRRAPLPVIQTRFPTLSAGLERQQAWSFSPKATT